MTKPKIVKLIEFTIPAIPPSYSASLKINFRLKQTYLSQDARRFKDKVKVYMPSHQLELKDRDRVIMHNKYHQAWYNKTNPDIKKQDVQNLDRLLIDAIFKGLGIDDRNLFCVINEKVHAPEVSKTVVALYLANGVEEYMNTTYSTNLPLQEEE
jgi:Holliday junction resolvase RusA-like endonuclease